MKISATLKDGWKTRTISMNLPILEHPLLPVTYVDSRWARPAVFHDIFKYPLSEPTSVQDDFNTIKSFGIFDNLNNGFDFIMRRTDWVPYVYENLKDSNNPLYGLNFKINQMGFDTICIFCDNDKTFLQIHCYSPRGQFCLDFF